jgi:hypothetical protein
MGSSRKAGSDEAVMRIPDGAIRIKAQSRKGSCMTNVLKDGFGGRNW